MIGKLYNAADGWIVTYKFDVTSPMKVLPLHSSDVNTKEEVNWDLFEIEGGMVEFDIVSEYSEKERRQIEYAKLKIKDTEKEENGPTVSDDFQIGPDGAYESKGWDEIFAVWASSKMYSKTIDGLQEFLEKNYFSPEKK